MKNTLDIAKSFIPVVKAAGEIEMAYFKSGTDVMGKKDGSPVTLADQKAEKFIIEELAKSFPDIPFVGEESVAMGTIPDISGGIFFLVDPLDGTRDFIEGGAEFTVNIALMENFKPIMGVIYAPVTHDLYYAGDGQAFSYHEGKDETLLSVRDVPDHGMTVIAGKRYPNPQQMTDYLKDKNVHDIKGCSSSLKFCLLASGDADLYPRFSPTCEWDTAAGEAILNAAGGGLTQLSGAEFVYGKAESKFLNPNFVAFSEKGLTQ